MLSPSGYVVHVGKNARDNDRLLALRHEAHALWFHTAGAPGKHVILEATAEAQPADVAFAAALVGARSVVCASVWDVDKPRYAKAGQVQMKKGSAAYLSLQCQVHHERQGPRNRVRSGRVCQDGA